MLLNPFTYHAPTTASQAAKLYAKLKNAQFLAGGTIVINTLKKLKKSSAKTPAHIISLKKISSLKKITLAKQAVTLGAMATCKEMMRSDVIQKHCPVLARVSQGMATTQIRNMATLGGNLMSRFIWAEFHAPLIAFNAELCFINGQGQSRTVRAEDFFNKGANAKGLLEKIIIKLAASSLVVYQRAPKRAEPDIPIFSVCIKTDIKQGMFHDPVIALNASLGFAQRHPLMEKALCGLHADETAAENFLKKIDISPLAKDDIYKHAVITDTLKKTIQELALKAQ